MRLRAAAFTAAVTAVAVPLGLAHDNAYARVDSEWYLLIAKGLGAEAIQPFTARQLDPLLARCISGIAHISLLHGFLILGLASLLITAGITGWILCRSGATVLAIAAVAGLYFWPALFGSFMLPDTLSAALLACFLFCLWRDSFAWAAVWLLPMFLARESTILVLLCLVIAGWRRLRWPVWTTAAIASLAGLGIVRSLSAHSLANREHLNPLLYMAGKIPWNFFGNGLAMQPWSAAVSSSCRVPRYTATLPFHLHIAGSATVGLCGWNAAWQVESLLVALCSFGLLPLLAAFLALRHGRAFWTEDLFTRFCIVYGGLSFFIAPLLGHTVERLFLYSWPVFLLATPLAASRIFGLARWKSAAGITVVVTHFVTAWLDYLVFWSWDQQSWQRAWAMAAALVLANIVAWTMLLRLEPKTTGL